jgi:hypothetical protein
MPSCVQNPLRIAHLSGVIAMVGVNLENHINQYYRTDDPEEFVRCATEGAREYNALMKVLIPLYYQTPKGQDEAVAELYADLKSLRGFEV